MKKKVVLATLLTLFTMLAAGLTINAESIGPNGECKWSDDDYIYMCTGGAGYCGEYDVKCKGLFVKVLPLHPADPWL